MLPLHISKIGKYNEINKLTDSNSFKRKLIVILFILMIYLFYNFIVAKQLRLLEASAFGFAVRAKYLSECRFAAD